MHLDFKYPGILLILSLVVAYFAVRYYYKKEDQKKSFLLTLFSLKFIFTTAALLLIFDPVIKIKKEVIRDLRHILLFDNSYSIALASETDTTGFRELYKKFSSDRSFLFYKFDYTPDTLSSADGLDFSGAFSNISSQGIIGIIDRAYSRENAVSLTVVTDGNFSDADNFSLKTGLPVNIICGSVRTKAPDIFIDRIDYDDNPASEPENAFTAVIGYTGESTAGKFTLKIMENGEVIRTANGNIPAPGSFTTIKAELPGQRSDLRELEFMISPLFNERNIYNNKKTAVQRLLKTTASFLIVADTPSLDMSFFVRLLRSAGYSCDIFYSADSDRIGDLGRYRSVIFFSLPVKSSKSDVGALASKFSSRLFFVTRKTDLEKLNAITDAGITSFSYVPDTRNLSGGGTDAGAFLFSRGPSAIKLDGLPGVEYNAGFLPSGKKYIPLVSVEGQSKNPVLFMSVRENPFTVIAGFSSFWKLLFNDWEDNFSNLMLNITDRTAADPSSGRIRMSPVKPEFISGEKIVFTGRVLDANLRPDISADPSLTIVENSLSAVFFHDKNELRSEFYLAEPGVYTARISFTDGAGVIAKDIKFRVSPNDHETSVTGADTHYLRSFARARNGRAVSLDSAAALLSSMSGKTETAVIESSLSLTRNHWFLILFSLIFITELALRKFKDMS